MSKSGIYTIVLALTTITAFLLLKPSLKGTSNAVDQCKNDSDKQILATHHLDMAKSLTSCGYSCFFKGKQCFQDCVQNLYTPQISVNCCGCFADSSDCALDHCKWKCINSASDSCLDCVKKNCSAGLQTCSGLTEDELPQA